MELRIYGMKPSLKKLLVVIFSLLLSLGGCAAPKPLGLAKTPDGPPNFRQGWEDGCETGMATESNSYYKTFYKFKQDPYQVTDPMYFETWVDAFRYCRDYVDKWTFDPIDQADTMDPNQ